MKLNVHIVAKYILEKIGTMSTMKLQKLCYYSQAWHMVWDDEPLFEEDFQAWANGPVCRSLYATHRRMFSVDSMPDIKGKLNESQKESIDLVLESYGDKSAQWLSDQTHREKPWINARKGVAPLERSENTISKASMAEYYASIN